MWATRDTFKLDQLDNYPVTVDATAADGGQVTAPSIGYLSYFAKMIFDPFTASRATVTYAHRSVVSEFEASRGADAGTINVRGSLYFTGLSSPGDPQIDIEFSRDGTSWHRRSTLPANSFFSATIPQTRPGYWRARYRGGRYFQPSVSDAVYADPR